jgi:hypothetical protein
MLRKSVVALALIGLSIGASSSALAGAIVSGFNTTAIPANDDDATGAIALGFNANFFGTTYGSTFVSNNGYVTFNDGQSTFTPTGLGAGYSGQPIIAAFFADVDTTGSGSGLTTYGAGTFDGFSAFGATWLDVGYYSGGTDKLNSFQLLLVNREDTGSGNFDIVFNYDKIQWETGSASDGTRGLGGTSAAAGYNAGTGAAGTFGQLTGSLVNGAFLDGGPNSLVANSNVGIAGRYIFNVRNGNVQPPAAVPEPATWAMMIGGFGVIGGAMRYRRRKLSVSFG